MSVTASPHVHPHVLATTLTPLLARWRRIHLWGFGVVAPAIVSAASILLISTRLP